MWLRFGLCTWFDSLEGPQREPASLLLARYWYMLPELFPWLAMKRKLNRYSNAFSPPFRIGQKPAFCPPNQWNWKYATAIMPLQRNAA